MYPSIKGWWNLTLLQERFQLSSSVLQCPLSYCQNWQLGPNSNLTAEMLLTAAGLEGNSGRFRECIGTVLCVTFFTSDEPLHLEGCSSLAAGPVFSCLMSRGPYFMGFWGQFWAASYRKGDRGYWSKSGNISWAFEVSLSTVCLHVLATYVLWRLRGLEQCLMEIDKPKYQSILSCNLYKEVRALLELIT